ncbi:unnamed protein product, partial [Rotaria magnacalcarata]
EISHRQSSVSPTAGSPIGESHTSSSPIGEDANAKKSHLLANVTIVDRQFGDCHTGNSPIWRMSH